MRRNLVIKTPRLSCAYGTRNAGGGEQGSGQLFTAHPFLQLQMVSSLRGGADEMQDDEQVVPEDWEVSNRALPPFCVHSRSDSTGLS